MNLSNRTILYAKMAGVFVLVAGCIGLAWQVTTTSEKLQTTNATRQEMEANTVKTADVLQRSNAHKQPADAVGTTATTTARTEGDTRAAHNMPTVKSGQTSTNPTPSVPPLNKLQVGRLSAESAIVWDRSRKEVLFAKSPRKEQPLASLTKLMTALVARQSTNTQEATTTLKQPHLDAVGEYGLKKGQVWQLAELIDIMLVGSVNDAARAVAGKFAASSTDGYASQFIDRMNTTAHQLGLEDTYFFNPSGLDINKNLISGGYGTAYDTAQLMDYILTQYPDLLAVTTQPSEVTQTANGENYRYENTNTALSSFTEVVGSKTGYTELAGGNLAMGFNLSRPVVIVVMGATKQGRFRDMQTLYQSTRNYFDTIKNAN